MEPLQRSGFYTVLKRREMAQPVLTKAFLYPAKTATMRTAYHDYDCPTLPPPSHW